MVSFPKISPNLLLGVGGVIAAVFLVNELRKAGGDLQSALTDIKLPDITLPAIKLPEIKFPEISLPEFKLPDIFGDTDVSSIAGKVIEQNGSFIGIPESTRIDPQTGIVTSVTPPALELSDVARQEALRQLELNRQRSIKEQELFEIPISEDISGAEFATAVNEAEFRRRQEEQKQIEQQLISPQEIISEIPTEQPFVGGGPSFVGGIIRENPIDTLSEVIKFFPELSASQARDFLESTGGQILPSQVELIDPDIRNIVAVGGDIPIGEQIQVDIAPLETLSIREQENIKAAEFTCREFGLNCELVDGMMA